MPDLLTPFMANPIYLVVLIVLIILWVATLVYQAKRRQWIWFVLTLIFSTLLMIVYWIVWYAMKPKWKKKQKW